MIMNPGNRTPAERAIIYGAILGKTPLEGVNRLLAQVGGRPLPQSSYRSIEQRYVPYFEEDMSRLGRAIQSPPTWSDLAV